MKRRETSRNLVQRYFDVERVTLLIGPPGTGKTSTLLEVVEQAIADGIDPDRIAYLAFTRKAADEAITRATKKFNLTRDDFPYFRTLHSLAFRELGLARNQVMSTADYTELGEGLKSYTFSHQYDSDMVRVPQGGGLGDRCLSMYSLARATRKSFEDIWSGADDPGITLPGLDRFIRALGSYKRELGKLDFTDFLDECKSVLDVDVFILDEAQDLTQQQWDFASRLASTAKKVYIAGDDDQAIFQWAGADLRTLLSLKGDRVVLPTSHRLPKNIYSLCNTITSRIKSRFPKTWDPREEEGQVAWLDGLSQVNPKAGSWMFLTRHRYQAQNLADFCRDRGVVYQLEGHWSNHAEPVQAVLSYERLRRGGSVSFAEAAMAAKYSQSSRPTQGKSVFEWNDIPWSFDGRPDWMSGLRLDEENKQYIRRLRHNGESLVKPGRVILSTIHGVKGGEADNVVLFTDITKRTQAAMRRDPDQEARVWYVGASRARKRLFPVMPQKSFLSYQLG